MASQSENSSISDGKDINLPEWTNSFSWNKREMVSRFDIFLLAMTVVIGGLVDDPFYGGLWVILASVIFTGIGYILLSFCLAEMTSTLPFSGGIYGFVRAFTHPMFGFYIAVFEFFVNIFYVASQIYLLAEIPIYAGVYNSNMTLPFCLFIYIFVLSITLPGGKIFWICNALIGALCLILLIIFVFGSIPAVDIQHYGNSQPFSIAHFLTVIPSASSGYVGIQFLPLASKYAKDSRKDIPIVMCIAMVVIVILNIFSNFVAAVQAPGADAIQELQFSLAPAFGSIFHLSSRTATWILFPGYLATAIGFIYCYGRQASSMAKSGLLPSILQSELPGFDSPYLTLMLGCSICFILNICMFYERSLVDEFALMAMLSSFLVYIGGCIAYLEFHRKYSNLTRFFTSPFGTAGAYICIVIFLICIVGGAGFQETFISLSFCLIVSGLIPPIYYLCIQKNMIFSEEEKEQLFKAYLINANLTSKQKLRNKKILKNNKIGPHTSNHSHATSNQNQNTTTANHVKSHGRSQSNRDNCTSKDNNITTLIQPTQKEDGNSESCTPRPVEFTNDLSSSRSSSRKQHIPSTSFKSNKNLSEKVLQFMSTKFNAIIPEEEDPDLKKLSILQQGGLFTAEEPIFDPPAHHPETLTGVRDVEMGENGEKSSE